MHALEAVASARGTLRVVLPGRAGAVAAARAVLADRGGVMFVGEAGGGRSSVLEAAAEVHPTARRGTGLELVQDVPHLALAMALRAAPPTASPADVADWVVRTAGPGPLVVDDADLADVWSQDVLVELVGHMPLATVFEEGRHDGLRARMSSAGAVDVGIGPLGDDVALHLLESLPPDAAGLVLRRAGGNARLLVDLRDGGLSARSVRILEASLERLGGSARRAVARLSLAGGELDVRALGEGGEELLRTTWCSDAGVVVRLHRGLIGEFAVQLLDETALRAEHAELARSFGVAGDGAAAARHLADSGESSAARRLALDTASTTEDGGVRTACLALAARCSPDDDPVLLDAADSLLQLGRISPARELVERSTIEDDRRQVLASRVRRLDGDHAGALSAIDQVVDRTAAAARNEDGLLGIWPGWHPERAGSTALAALATWPRPPSTAVADLRGSGGGEEELVQRIAVIALLALDAKAAEADAATLSLARWCASQPVPAWRMAGEIARRLLSFHLGEALDSDDLVATGSSFLAAHAALALADLGRVSEALRALPTPATRATGEAAIAAWVSAEVNLVAGRLQAARRDALESMRSAGPSFPTFPLAVLTAAWAAADAGEDHPPVSPIERHLAVGHASAIELLALEQRRAGAPGDAATTFDEAARAWEGLSFRAGLRCAWAGADAAGSVPGLQTVEAEAMRRGALPIVGRARHSLRRLGVRSRAARVATEGGLTGREREVLALVADGATSREIAQRLGVARATVETQITSAMGKLGARTRLQAVAVLAERSAS
jgi:DNA-binding CsgD family transcriptional regulator